MLIDMARHRGKQWLLADACAADGRLELPRRGRPVKVVKGARAPVNPIAIRQELS